MSVKVSIVLQNLNKEENLNLIFNYLYIHVLTNVHRAISDEALFVKKTVGSRRRGRAGMNKCPLPANRKIALMFDHVSS